MERKRRRRNIKNIDRKSVIIGILSTALLFTLMGAAPGQNDVIVAKEIRVLDRSGEGMVLTGGKGLNIFFLSKKDGKQHRLGDVENKVNKFIDSKLKCIGKFLADATDSSEVCGYLR